MGSLLQRRWRRPGRAAAALAVLFFWMSGLPGPGAVALAEQAPDPGARVPVVLVHGLGGAGQWGSLQDRGSLLGALAAAGYRLGRDLFIMPAGSNGDNLAQDAVDLRQLLLAVRQKTGSPVADAVTHSNGALTARYYADAFAGTGAPALRQIIMIAPPSRGSDLADVVRRSAIKERVLGLWDSDQEGDGEVPFVLALARQIMPHYRRFLSDGWLLVRGQPSSFVDWVARHDAGLAAVFTQESPPKGPAVPPRPTAAVPGFGRDLSTAYYGDAALDAVRYVYQQRRPLYEVAAEEWWRGIQPAADWRAVVLNWIKDRLAKLAAFLLQREGTQLWHRAATHTFTRWADTDPLAPFMRQVVAEELKPAADSGIGPKIPANVWLRRWNDGYNGRRGPLPRLVYIAGSVLSTAAAVSSGLPEGDGAVAFRAALLPAGPDDAWHGVTGWPGGHHWGLLRDPGVHGQVLAALQWGAGAAAAGRVGPDSPSTQVSAPAAAPTYIEVDGDQEGTVIIAAGGPDGSMPGLWAWLLAVNHHGAARRTDIGFIPAGSHQAVDLAALDLPAGGRLFIGARAHGGGEPRWQPPATMDGLLAGGTVPVTVTWQPQAPGAEEPPVPPMPEEQPPPPDAPGPETGTGQGPEHEEPLEPGEPGSDPDSPDRPLVRVILRSHRITKYHERHRHHYRWEWDMGDGTAFQVEGADTAVYTHDHAFASPGDYRVTARSVAPDGTVLRQLSWDVSVSPEAAAAGEEWSFTAYGPQAPGITAHIEGPGTWITGRPATFRVRAEVTPPPYGEILAVNYDPGREFDVVWARPGKGFIVRAAVLVDVRYTYPDGRRQTWRHVALAEKEIEILATSVGGS
ncbi:MAG TPA: hypothetical protein VK008_02055 [Sphingobacteriaceae bacterium]|nr:hypothetical protein [Sphingobacteriaceae bacterium]